MTRGGAGPDASVNLKSGRKNPGLAQGDPQQLSGIHQSRSYDRAPWLLDKPLFWQTRRGPCWASIFHTHLQVSKSGHQTIKRRLAELWTENIQQVIQFSWVSLIYFQCLGLSIVMAIPPCPQLSNCQLLFPQALTSQASTCTVLLTFSNRGVTLEDLGYEKAYLGF